MKVVASAAISHIEEVNGGHLFVVTSEGVFEWDGSRLVTRTDLVKRVSPSGDVYHVFADRFGFAVGRLARRRRAHLWRIDRTVLRRVGTGQAELGVSDFSREK
jgi:hypothetical protein